MPITPREFSLPSANGEGDLFCRSYLPEGKATAVVYIAHGMCEHSGRYGRLCTLLAERGCAVYMNDHCGHGRSAMGHPGTFSLQGNGFAFVMTDILRMLDMAGDENPGVPRFLIGHSMGSMLAGLIADRCGDRLDGLVMLGMPSPNSLSGFGSRLAGMIARLRGQDHDSLLLRTAAHSATAGVRKAPRVVLKQWLSHNMENVREYAEDPLSQFEFSASAMEQLMGGLKELCSEDWGKGMPKKLPVLIMSGTEDRGGNYGEAPRNYARHLEDIGMADVTLHLVEGARHEIFNELDTRDADGALLAWLAEHTPAGGRISGSVSIGY